MIVVSAYLIKQVADQSDGGVDDVADDYGDGIKDARRSGNWLSFGTKRFMKLSGSSLLYTNNIYQGETRVSNAYPDTMEVVETQLSGYTMYRLSCGLYSVTIDINDDGTFRTHPFYLMACIWKKENIYHPGFYEYYLAYPTATGEGIGATVAGVVHNDDGSSGGCAPPAAEFHDRYTTYYKVPFMWTFPIFDSESYVEMFLEMMWKAVYDPTVTDQYIDGIVDYIKQHAIDPDA